MVFHMGNENDRTIILCYLNLFLMFLVNTKP